MKVRLLGQPFNEEDQLGKVLATLLADRTSLSLWLVTAWAKRSGLSRVAKSLESFRNRGGRAEAIVGIDEGGATLEGLQLALESFDRVYVFHDPGPRTFHPKFYVVEGKATATIILGSGNLTKGGLYTNYEADLVVDIDKGNPGDVALLSEVRGYYRTVRGQGRACRRLSLTLLREMAADASLRIESEAIQNRARARVAGSSAPNRQFGDPIAGLALAPKSQVRPVPRDDADEDLPVARPRGSGFFKALSSFDVNPHSAPGQIIIPIRFQSFFPALTVEKDETAHGGVRQSSAHFPVLFRDGRFTRRVIDARAVLYEPAKTHPRPNVELRFTFRDQHVFARLSKDDLLVFIHDGADIVVERRAPGALGRRRYDIYPGA